LIHINKSALTAIPGFHTPLVLRNRHLTNRQVQSKKSTQLVNY